MNKNCLKLLARCVFFASILGFNISAEAQTIKYTYDVLGRVTLVEDGVNGKRDYDYDAAGNRVLLKVGNAAPPVIAPAGGNFINAVNVNISAPTSGSIIRYTTNNTTVTDTSTTYANALTLMSSTVLRAKAFHPHKESSQEVRATFTMVAAIPTISPAGATFNGSGSVILSSSTSGATIRYTADNSAVTAVSPVYSGALTLTTNTVIRAKAFKWGMTDSAETSANFIVKVLTPTISPAGGTTNGSATVHLACPTAGALIRYTTNNTAVTTSSPFYSAPITLTASATLRVKAFKTGMTDSDEPSAGFTVHPYITPIIFTPAGGPYEGSVTVSLSTAASGAAMYYSLNAPNVTTASTLYTGPFVLTQHTTVYAKAFKAGMANIPENSATYLFNLPAPTIGAYACTQIAPGVYKGMWGAVAGATSYQYRTVDNNEYTVTSTTATYASECVWVKACRSASDCSAKTYFKPIYMAAKPVISLASGTYNLGTTVSVTSTTSGTIRYTLDGSAVTSNSAIYGSPLTLPVGTTILTAKTMKADMLDSDAASATFVIIPAASAPTITPGSGAYNGSVTVSLTTTTSDSTIYYSLNGGAYVAYSSPIVLTESTTVKSYATKAGISDSTIVTMGYAVYPIPAPMGLSCRSVGPGAWQGSWNPVSGATSYQYRTNVPEITTTVTGTSSVGNSTCKWVMACNANNACSAKVYF